MRVIVTRPAPQAAEWVARLRGRGIDAVALPLIDILAVADPEPLRDAWGRFAEFGLVLFVSPNAVVHFFAQQPAGVGWPASTWAASPGPGTTAALLHAGVPPARIIEPAADAEQFDSESLWCELRRRAWTGQRVLIVRGDGGRGELAHHLRAAGAQVSFLAAYRRAPPGVDGGGLQLLREALSEPATHLWCFSSSEAIDNLMAAVATTDWGRSRALATHPRIAARARAHGFGHVLEARPAVEAVVACIQSAPP